MGGFAFQIDAHGVGLQFQGPPGNGDRHRNADPAPGLIVGQFLGVQGIVGVLDDHIPGDFDIVGHGVQPTTAALHRDLAAVFPEEHDPHLFQRDRLRAVAVIGGSRLQAPGLAAVLGCRVLDLVDGDIGAFGERFHQRRRVVGKLPVLDEDHHQHPEHQRDADQQHAGQCAFRAQHGASSARRHDWIAASCCAARAVVQGEHDIPVFRGGVVATACGRWGL